LLPALSYSGDSNGTVTRVGEVKMDRRPR